MQTVISRRMATALLALIVAAYLAVGSLYAVYTPPWQSPDEPAHANYVAQVAGEGCCPVLAPGDWDAAHLDELKAAGFPDDADLSPIEYEDHQPPLYYLIAAPVYHLAGGDLIALRLVSVLLGAGVVVAAYLAGARLLPHRRTVALAAALIVAFIPQHVAMLASVNNDGLAWLVMGVLIVAALAYLGLPGDALGGPVSARRPHAAVLGGLAGIAFLTKLTAYSPAALAVAVAVALRWRIERRPARWLLNQALWVAGPALVLGGLWWARNLAIYGWPDLLAQGTHDVVVVGQLRTAELVAQIGLGAALGRFLTTTYQSFWGQFGWMAVPMPARVYLLTGLFLLVSAAGLVLRLIASPLRRMPAPRLAGMGVLAAVVLATVANYLYYNLTFVQFQGRYLFTALIPLALLAAAGLWGWVAVLKPRLPGQRWARALEWLPLAGTAWLPPLAVYALFRFVVPHLA